MPCSFQLVPNFLVKNALFGDRYFFYIIFFHKFLCILHNIKLFKVFGWTTSLAQGNGPSGSGEIGFQRGFTIYEHVSHLGHVTRRFCIKFC